MHKIKHQKWEVLEEVDVSPSPWLTVVRQKVRLPNGKVVDDYYLTKMGDVSMIVPITKDKEIVFVRQYKHGIGKIVLELPAGRIKPGKTPLDGAKMELQEETGYVCDNLIELGSIYFEPTKDSLKVHGYLAVNLENPGPQLQDETEFIEVVKMPINQIDEKIESGEIAVSDTLAFLKIAQLKAPEYFK